jgi:glycine cleavage system H protein
MKFTEEHLWMRVEDDMVIVGITEFAAAELGEIAFVE